LRLKLFNAGNNMKKKMLRKLREISNDIIGEEETNKIIEDTVKEEMYIINSIIENNESILDNLN